MHGWPLPALSRTSGVQLINQPAGGNTSVAQVDVETADIIERRLAKQCQLIAGQLPPQRQQGFNDVALLGHRLLAAAAAAACAVAAPPPPLLLSWL